MKSTTPQMTIVIVTYKRPGLAQVVVQTLLSHKSDYQIIVVDQESTSRITEDQAREWGIEYLNLPQGNISVARNQGLKKAVSDLILFIDDDVEISKGGVDAHIAAYEDIDVVAVAGRVINDGENIPKNTSVETGKTNFLGTRFIQQYWSTKKQSVEFPYGCNMSFRRNILLEIGGFDENLPRIFDDIDIGFRIKKMGTILFEPQALAYHHKAKSGGIRESNRSHQKMLYTYYGYYLGKSIPFPLSLVSVIMRMRTILFEAPYAVADMISGYMNGLSTTPSSHATTAESSKTTASP